MPKELVKYAEAIVLEFSDDAKHAWLRMKNYSWTLDTSSDLDTVKDLSRGFVPSLKLAEYKKSISISELFDAIDVIKLQKALIQVFRQRFGKVEKLLTPDETYRVIESALKSLNIIVALPVRPAGTAEQLELEARKALCLSSAIQQHNLKLLYEASPRPAGADILPLGSDLAAKAKSLGFIAYLPQPKLIAEEERAKLMGEPWKTKRIDTRDLSFIPVRMLCGSAASSDFNPKLKVMRRRLKESQPSAVDPSAVPSTVDSSAMDSFIGKLDADSGETDKKKLHSGLPRISCYAFRGDSRSPEAIKEAEGLWPGITRDDDGVKYLPKKYWPNESTPVKHPSYEAIAEALDAVLKSDNFDMTKYDKSLTDHGALHLGRYTADQTLKAYISATKSVAIAKSFSNYWATDRYVRSYCYALRCWKGFELPSTLPTKDKLKELHEFAEFAEQEVAVPGQIGWSDVVGYRVIRAGNDKGQFFFGPVFLRDELRNTDVSAFYALFNQLSGQSQGVHMDIERSYPTAPW